MAIPVVVNGDVRSAQDAVRALRETGCAGVSIGRGAFYDPWIFRRTAQLLRTGELVPEPDFAERENCVRDVQHGDPRAHAGKKFRFAHVGRIPVRLRQSKHRRGV